METVFIHHVKWKCGWVEFKVPWAAFDHNDGVEQCFDELLNNVCILVVPVSSGTLDALSTGMPGYIFADRVCMKVAMSEIKEEEHLNLMQTMQL